MSRESYAAAFADWLACSIGGATEPAAVAAAQASRSGGLLEHVVTLGASGHVLDFDDTYQPGLAHISAAAAPAALVLGDELKRDIEAVLGAYTAGFEAMATLARVCHPALYDGGWHPTAVCGSAGAAVAAARMLGLDDRATRTAIALALLRAGGLRAAFGSDGKALQVGLAAADGVHAARLAAAGAAVGSDAIAGGVAGFAEAFGVAMSAATLDDMLAAAGGSGTAIADNWIKAYPCCLQTHACIDAALAAGAPPAGGVVEVAVHPLSRQAAAIDDPADGLQAKFSIPYLTASALLRGVPRLDSFAAVDREAAALGRRIGVRTDAALGASEAILSFDGRVAGHITAPKGSPSNPLTAAELALKIRALSGEAVDFPLADLQRPASVLVAAWSAAAQTAP